MATRKSILILFGILLISAWVLGFAIQAGAETLRVKVSAYCTQIEVIRVGDMEGHGVFVSSYKGLAFFENGDVATYTNWGKGDSIKGKTAIDSYSGFTFEDGSTIFYKVKGIWQPGPKELAIGKGTGEFTKGTGKYEGIKGDLTWTGKRYTNYSKEKGTLGDFVLEVTGTYSLLPK